MHIIALFHLLDSFNAIVTSTHNFSQNVSTEHHREILWTEREIFVLSERNLGRSGLSWLSRFSQSPSQLLYEAAKRLFKWCFCNVTVCPKPPFPFFHHHYGR